MGAGLGLQIFVLTLAVVFMTGFILARINGIERKIDTLFSSLGEEEVEEEVEEKVEEKEKTDDTTGSRATGKV